MADLPPVVVPPAKLVRRIAAPQRQGLAAGSPRHCAVESDYRFAASVPPALVPPRACQISPDSGAHLGACR